MHAINTGWIHGQTDGYMDKAVILRLSECTIPLGWLIKET